VERHNVSSGSAWEAKVGYSRAVRVGSHVSVSGTAPIMPGDADPPPDAYGQARRCLEIMVTALAEAGARPQDVVRTRIYLTRTEDMPDVGRAHAEVFGEVRPASTAVTVKELVDPRWLVELEADALIPPADGGPDTQ
jgi:enamine deaminase RidA (YjgF/YER057c/UK114 family)